MSPSSKPAMTKKACPGCGEVPSVPRPADSVCRDCQQLLTEALATRARLAADERQVYRAPQYVGSFFYFSVPGEPSKTPEGAWIGHDDRLSNRLRRAFETLCRLHLEPIPWQAVRERGIEHKDIELLFPDPTGVYYERQGMVVLASPAAIAAIRALAAVITEAIATAEQTGLTKGSSLLSQLAAGAITAEDFTKKAVLGDPDATVRRVYNED